MSGSLGKDVIAAYVWNMMTRGWNAVFGYNLANEGRIIWFGWNDLQWALLLSLPGETPTGLSEVLVAGSWN